MKASTMFKPRGIVAALVTPFSLDGTIDEASLRNLTRFLIESRVHSLLSNGGTGEYASLSVDERKKAFTIVRDEAKGRVPVVGGVLETGIGDAIDMMKFYRDAGASGVLLTTPYYNRPSQSGIFEYFKEARDSTDIPIILYNIPQRTGIDIEPATLSKLADLDRIVGIKECNREIGQFLQKIRLAGDKLQMLAGDDDIAYQQWLMGAKGAVLASACLIPKTWVEIFEAFDQKKFDAANELNHNIILPLCKPLFAEHNPAPLKEGLVLARKIENAYCRKPISVVTESTKEALKNTMLRLKLVK